MTTVEHRLHEAMMAIQTIPLLDQHDVFLKCIKACIIQKMMLLPRELLFTPELEKVIEDSLVHMAKSTDYAGISIHSDEFKTVPLFATFVEKPPGRLILERLRDTVNRTTLNGGEEHTCNVIQLMIDRLADHMKKFTKNGHIVVEKTTTEYGWKRREPADPLFHKDSFVTDYDTVIVHYYYTRVDGLVYKLK